MGTKRTADVLLPVVVLVLGVVLWELAVWFFDVPAFIAPRPAEVASALWTLRVDLAVAGLRTASASAGALVLSTVAGCVTACVFAWSVMLRRALYPWAILLQTVPIIAVAPLMILLFGRGFHSVMMVAVVISVFPVITNATTGLLQVDEGLEELFRLHRASWWQRLWRLRLPAALPWVISGVRIASGVAVVGAIVGEFFMGSSQPGLGAWIQRKNASADLPGLYATVVVSTLLGVSVFALLSWLGDLVLRHWFGRRLDGTASLPVR